MNAIEFVKKFGLEISIKLQREMIGITEDVADEVAGWGQSEWDKLKKIVEAFELVMEHGSVERAKKYAESNYTAPEVKEYLLRAIELVEEVCGG